MPFLQPLLFCDHKQFRLMAQPNVDGAVRLCCQQQNFAFAPVDICCKVVNKTRRRLRKPATLFRQTEGEAVRRRSKRRKRKGVAVFATSFILRPQASRLMAEAKGFEPLYRLLGNRISSAGRYDHFDTLPQSHTIISTLRPIVNGCRHIRSAKRMRRKLVRSLNGKRSCNRCK